ncbi:cardiolipin synthase [Prevotella sp. E13-17]|uniref:cardiolipin synthase n=1 Tax=Prevotella sp. E13-17 TaxID=2913616 RepID=UPI001EDB9EE7|nr:cardiolipin synthase [Prevotella sp. E13-17]UKK49901.1 cardiolipin synthase [Prevotella sp. E13-17]
MTNKHTSIRTRALLTVALAFCLLRIQAQEPDTSSDTLIYNQLKSYGIRFSDNNNIKVIMSGQEKFDSMFDDIRQARHSIHLEYFNFRNDSIAMQLFELLKEKRREGVEVRALFDAFGNDSNNQPLLKKHIKALRNDSIDIWEFDPIRFPWVNHIWPRDHRKIVVIDGKIAYTGGMNVADYYIKGTEQVGAWRDMHCRIEGGTVNDLQHIFAKIWKKTTKEDISQKTEYFQGEAVGNKCIGIVNREPRTTNDAMRYFYVNAINDAKDSIRIINPYFTLRPCITKALKRAIKRGVKVELMISAKSDIPLTPDCAFYNMHRMMKKGAHVWLYQPGFHHSKIMMVDGKFCTIGSTNLDARSLRFDYEENAVIIDKETTLELDHMFDRDKHESIYMTKEVWNEFRTPWQKFRGWFAHLLSPFL